MRSRSHGAGGLVAIIAATLVVSPASAGAEWSQPESLSERATSGAPAIAVRGPTTWVAFGGDPDQRQGIHLVTKVGDSIEVERVTTKWDGRPSIAVGPGGAVHIAFIRFCRGHGPCIKGLFYATRHDGQWTVERVHEGFDAAPSIALDGDRPRIAFVNLHEFTYWRLWLARKQGGDWVVERLRDPDHPRTGGPSLAFDPATGDGYVAYRRHLRDVQTEIRRLSDPVLQKKITDAAGASDPDIVVDEEGRVHFAYVRRGEGLWYARWTPGGGVVRHRIADVGRRKPAIAILPGGVGIVAETAGGIIFRTNVSGSWQGSRITRQSGDRYPDIDASGAGRARVVFSRVVADGSRKLFLSQASFPGAP